MTSNNLCPHCHSQNTFSVDCCKESECVECGEVFPRSKMLCPGDLIDAAEIMGGDR